MSVAMPDGAFGLGALLRERGALDEAAAAYGRASIAATTLPLSNLGVLLAEHGAPAEAEAAYRRADERGDADAAFNLGVLLEDRGALAEAEAAYVVLEQRGDGEVANMARAALLDLGGERGKRPARRLRKASAECLDRGIVHRSARVGRPALIVSTPLEPATPTSGGDEPRRRRAARSRLITARGGGALHQVQMENVASPEAAASARDRPDRLDLGGRRAVRDRSAIGIDASPNAGDGGRAETGDPKRAREQV